MNELPPLPWADAYPQEGSDQSLFDEDQMHAYGQQCRDAALLEAAELCDCDEAARYMTPADIAAVLRAKVKK